MSNFEKLTKSIQEYIDFHVERIINDSIDIDLDKLSKVATSGLYDDLLNKPEIVSIDQVREILATVALSGSYNDLTNKPTIPSEEAMKQSIMNNLSISTVGKTGNYDDILNKPDYNTMINRLDDKIRVLQANSGKSAYAIAVEHGFNGTEEEWLDSLNSNILVSDTEPTSENIKLWIDSDLITEDIEGIDTATVRYVDDKIADVSARFNYINVLDYGIINDGVTDNTALIESLITKGYTNLYFPNGSYVFSITIRTSNINIIGESMKETIFIPNRDIFVFKIDCTNGNIDNNHFSMFTIRNKDGFTNCKAIYLVGERENDRHVFENIIINNYFSVGIHLQGRSIWSIFRNMWIAQCTNNGILMDTSAVKNMLSFNNVTVRDGKRNGIMLNSEGGETYKSISFTNCTIENNCKETSVENQYAINLNNIDEISFINCYIENNYNDVSNCYGIYSSCTYTRSLNIISSLIWGNKNGIKLDSTIMSGVIIGNRLLNTISDISIGDQNKLGGGHEESAITLAGNTLSKTITNTHDINMNMSTISFNPFTLPYRHANNSSTPDVKNCNIIMSWTTDTITNFLNGTNGQIVVLYVYGLTEGQTKPIENNSNISLKSDNIYYLFSGDCISFIYFNGVWKELFSNISIER